MKKNYFVIVFTFVLISSSAQVAFEENIITSANLLAYGINSVYATDIDGDGDMDLLSASEQDDKITWYENTDGEGGFGKPRVITQDADGANFVYAADLDGDGDMDVLSSAVFGNDISWYENLDGQGNYGSIQVITDNAENARSVHAADIDGDGDLDVLSANSSGSKLAWYENTDGQGAFGIQQVITNSLSGAWTVFSGDFDGDGDNDVLCGSSFDNKVTWYENIDGQGTFGAQQIITSMANGVESVLAADIDNDGDLDVLSASFIDDKIAWYENTDGQGSFGSQQIISNVADGARCVRVADINNDGDLDVLSVSSFDNKIAWYDNIDGQGIFSAEQIISNSYGDTSICVADFNNDGSIDIVTDGFNNAYKFVNIDGLGNFSDPRAVISATNEARSVYAADIDGDLDLDILSASSGDNKLAWYENLNAFGEFGPQQEISILVDDVSGLIADDIDGDGDNDFVAFSEFGSSSIVWFENIDGLGNFVLKQIVDTAITFKSIFLADLDGDADLDILSSIFFSDQIVWYENTDGQGTFGSSQLISNQAYQANYAHSADIDGDGDMDVLSASDQDNKIAWYENTDGLGSFGSQQIISTLVNDPSYVTTGDLDGDGDMDVVSGSFGDQKLAWYENLDGLGDFGVQQVISTSLFGASDIRIADLDHDGDLDIVSASPSNNRVAWYENVDGSGNFGIFPMIISNEAFGAVAVYTADVNGDMVTDVLSASFLDDKIAWYENQLTLSADEFSIESFNVFPNPVSNQLNIQNESIINAFYIYDVNGRLLLWEKLLQNKSEHKFNTDILKSGVYLIEIYSGTSKSVKKFIKN